MVFGLFSAVDNPARMAFVQGVVGRDMVRNAVSLNTTLVDVARVAGPTVAAVLVATVGIGWCFVVNAISFGFVIASLISLDTRRLHPVPPVHRGPGQLRADLRYAAGGAHDHPTAADDGAGRHAHVRVRGQPAAAGGEDVPRHRHHLQLADRHGRAPRQDNHRGPVSFPSG